MNLDCIMDLFSRMFAESLCVRQKSHATLFLMYLNNKHSSIEITSDPEANNSLAFLDVSVKRSNKRFTCNVFRKATFSRIGISFFSFCCKKFKTNSVLALLNRAYTVCSNYHLIH